MQRLGEIELCTSAVDEKIWYLYIHLSVTLRGHHTVCSGGTYLRQALCQGLLVDFDSVFTFHLFSEGIADSDRSQTPNFHRKVAPQFSRNCCRKLRKVEKPAEKFVCTILYT